MVTDRSAVFYGSVIVIGTGTAILLYRYWQNRKLKIPKKWKKIGELSDLVCFPIKSMGPVRLNSMECTVLGLKSGWMRDRTLMVVDLDGKFVTARQIPKMILISPSFSGSVLTLQFEAKSCSVDLLKIVSEKKSLHTIIYNQDVTSYDCGDEIAIWLSKLLLESNTGLRLVYYPSENPCRAICEKNKVFHKILKVDSGAYPDETSYSLQNEASIIDLNERLDEPVTALWFRPNFLIKGPKALEEDKWDWMKIGNVIFRSVRPCTRCVLTTINPQTGEKNGKYEPVATLRKYRRVPDAAQRKAVKDTPMMGIHLGLRCDNAVINLGDSVYINE